MGMFSDGWDDEVQERRRVEALFKKYIDSVEGKDDIVFTYEEEGFLNTLREKPSKKNANDIPF